MKKYILVAIAILSVSFQVNASSAQQLLRKARADYYKEQEEIKRKEEEKAKAKEEAKKASEKSKQKETKSESTSKTKEKEVLDKEKKEKVQKVKKTKIEQLEDNVSKANEKVDFYERVVRSVQREEKELENLKKSIEK